MIQETKKAPAGDSDEELDILDERSCSEGNFAHLLEDEDESTNKSNVSEVNWYANIVLMMIDQKTISFLTSEEMSDKPGIRKLIEQILGLQSSVKFFGLNNEVI